MNAFFYLARKSLKNKAVDLLHHPGTLIVYVVIILMMLFSAFFYAAPREEEQTLMDRRWLEGVYLGLLLLTALPALMRGVKSGASFFTMADVSFLFVAPVRPKRVLAYGLLRQLGATALVAFFLIAYCGMAMRTFGISAGEAVLLLVGFALNMVVAQLLTMLCYSFANGDERRMRGVKYGIYALLGLAAAIIALKLSRGGVSEATMRDAVSSPVLEYLPFVGWMKGLAFAVLYGETARAALFGSLLAVGCAGAACLFMRSDADYYEDVLQNTESTYAMRQAMKEGNAFAKENQKRVRVGKTGLGAGWGAGAFFYKHLRELRRRSPFVFLSGGTLLLGAGCAFMGFVMRGAAEEGQSPAGLQMMGMLIFGVYVLLFSNAMGEWSRELTKPYLYLMPASPLKKLLWASLTTLLKPLVDGALVFTAAGVIVGAGPALIAVCALMYASFGAVFTACNLLSQRVFGQMANRGLIMMLYMLMLLLIVAPGVAAGVVLYYALQTPGFVMGLPVIAWNLLASAGIYALCHGILHDMEAQ
jgi:hypothetical protein